MLTHFDPSKALRLECDASPHGIGAVLSHRVAGVDKPIGFRSRTLTQAERNYSQLEREGLSIGVRRKQVPGLPFGVVIRTGDGP